MSCYSNIAPIIKPHIDLVELKQVVLIKQLSEPGILFNKKITIKNKKLA